MDIRKLIINTSHRSPLPEIMDDFDMKGEELRNTLRKIGTINRYLGGNSVTLNGVWKLIDTKKNTRTITIADMGCGHGELLRTLVMEARAKNLSVRCIGFDANADAIKYAQELSIDFPEIEYKVRNFFEMEPGQPTADIIISTLTMHHLSDEQIKDRLKEWKRAGIGIVINDLHRSRLACSLFQILSVLINLPAMARYDGLVSIMRGFKKQELQKLSDQLKLQSKISWKWAFRYQWIIINQ